MRLTNKKVKLFHGEQRIPAVMYINEKMPKENR